MRLGLGMGLGRPRGPSGPKVFVASSLPGCTLDLDAAVGFSGAAWLDQSGAGHDFTPTVAPTATTVGGFPALDFNGSSHFLTQASGNGTALFSTTELMILAVCVVDAVNTNSNFYSINDSVICLDNARVALALRSAPEMMAADYDGSAFHGDAKAITLGALTLLAMRFKGGKLYASVNGSADGPGTSTSAIDSLAAIARIGINTQGAPDYTDMKLLRLAAYNAAADASWAAAKAGFKTQYGIG